MDVSLILNLLNKASESGFVFCSLRGSVLRVVNGLAMLLVFVLCMRILHFGLHFKGLMRFLCEFGSKPKNGVFEICASMITNFKCGPLTNNSSMTQEKSKSDDDDDVDDMVFENEREVHDEDCEIDVMKLREMLRIERERANLAYEEIERERRASESAAEEAMTMIVRLQSEKSSIEMEANQFKRLAEKKQQYDQEMIESLHWVALQNESQISFLEQKLIMFRGKLKQFMNDDDIQKFERLHDDDGNAFSEFCVDEDLDDS